MANIPTPERTLESVKWLMNTHHRDLDDQLMYKTTKVYTIRHKGEDYIVADRVLLLPNNKYTDLGDTKRIHIGDIERYTLDFESVQPQTLNVTLTSSVDDMVPDDLMVFLRALPPSQDPMREFILTAGLIVLPDPKLPKTHKMAMKTAEAANWLSLIHISEPTRPY